MKDQIDHANELVEKTIEFALAKHKAKPTVCSLSYCQDCDEPIPEQRRKTVIGCTRCIECQTRYEHKAKGYRK